MNFTKKELEALDRAIEQLGEPVTHYLVALRNKCVSFNHTGASQVGLSRLDQARKIIVDSEMGITCDELGEQLGVSLATIYRMVPKLNILDEDIQLCNRLLYYKGSVCLPGRYNKDKMSSVGFEVLEKEILCKLKSNPAGLKFGLLMEELGVSESWLLSKLDDLKAKGVKRSFGVCYLNKLPDESLLPKYMQICRYVLNTGSPLMLTCLQQKFGLKSISRGDLNEFDLIKHKGWVGKYHWLYKDGLIKEKYASNKEKALNHIIKSKKVVPLKYILKTFGVRASVIKDCINNDTYNDFDLIVKNGCVGNSILFDS